MEIVVTVLEVEIELGWHLGHDVVDYRELRIDCERIQSPGVRVSSRRAKRHSSPPKHVQERINVNKAQPR